MVTKTWDDGWQNSGQDYRVRLYEDMRGDQNPILVVERSDGKLMEPEEARGVYSSLEQESQVEQARLWEQTSDGKIYERNFSEYQNDINTTKHDLAVGEYEQTVADGSLRQQMSTAYNDFMKEVTPEQALQETGETVRSYEQQVQAEWIDLQAPSQGYD